MYDIKFEDGKWWITKDGVICDSIGGFVDPISPKMIIKEIEENGEI
jgi:hypothetical protein